MWSIDLFSLCVMCIADIWHCVIFYSCAIDSLKTPLCSYVRYIDCKPKYFLFLFCILCHCEHVDYPIFVQDVCDYGSSTVETANLVLISDGLKLS